MVSPAAAVSLCLASGTEFSKHDQTDAFLLRLESCGSAMSWDCGFKYLFALSPTLKAGVLCKLQERDDIGRIELVQKLARENCQFLQADRKQPEKTDQVRHFLFGFSCLFLVGREI